MGVVCIPAVGCSRHGRVLLAPITSYAGRPPSPVRRLRASGYRNRYLHAPPEPTAALVPVRMQPADVNCRHRNLRLLRGRSGERIPVPYGGRGVLHRQLRLRGRRAADDPEPEVGPRPGQPDRPDNRRRGYRDARMALLDEAVRGKSVALVARAANLHHLSADGRAVARVRSAAAARTWRAPARLLSLSCRPGVFA